MRQRRRRALTADELSLTPEDRKAIRTYRTMQHSSRYQRERAIEKSSQLVTQPDDTKK